jgi:hypothetical protein
MGSSKVNDVGGNSNLKLINFFGFYSVSAGQVKSIKHAFLMIVFRGNVHLLGLQVNDEIDYNFMIIFEEKMTVPSTGDTSRACCA